MSLDLAKKPLEIRRGKSETRNVSCGGDDLEETLRDCLTGDADVIAWEMHRIVAGRYEHATRTLRLADGSRLSPELLLELRAFNKSEELRLTREGEKFFGRDIRDGEGDDAEYVDSLARLWGRRESAVDGFVTLRDTNRKLHLTIPCDEDSDYFGLVTRIYIGYAESGLAGYVDFRFVKITAAEDE